MMSHVDRSLVVGRLQGGEVVFSKLLKHELGNLVPKEIDLFC